MLEVNGNTCPASVEVEIVETNPFDPVYANPCESDGSLNAPVKLLATETLFASPNNVDEANVHVEVEKE